MQGGLAAGGGLPRAREARVVPTLSERDGAAPGEPPLPALRHTLVQAAWAAQRCRRTDPLQRWARAVQRRRGKRVAAVAVARKLAGLLYALWRDGTTYAPEPATT